MVSNKVCMHTAATVLIHPRLMAPAKLPNSYYLLFMAGW